MHKLKCTKKLKMTSSLGSVTDIADKKVETLEPLTKKIKYPPTGKSDQILEQLHMRRADGEFCDVQIQYSTSKIVHAHKSILATCSPYFEGMFSSAFLEATTSIVDLSHITDRDDVLENVIDTFYGRTFEINEDNVSETLNLATMLLLDDLKVECAKVLYGLVQVRNASQMLQLAINYDLQDLREKVQPIIQSRFHDYILLQDELLELNVEGFEFLIDNINTKLISRKAKYIEFLLKWFLVCESDERAHLLKKAIKKIQFKITRRAYMEFVDKLEVVNGHLDDENADVSAQMRLKLKRRLLNLKPGAVKTTSPLLPVESNLYNAEYDGKREDSDSEIEEEPKRELYNTFGALIKVLGPPTKEEGFTKKEEEKWAKAHKDMAERDQHREWAKKWPLDLLNTLGTHDDPNRPKKIIRESPPEIFKSRKRRIKSPEELANEAKLLDAVIVLSPTKTYLNKIESKGTTSDDFEDDILEVCAYIPRKHAWYRVTSFSASSIEKKFNPNVSQEQASNRRRRSRPDDSDEEDLDDEEAIEMAMMGMYGADMPEMLMMMRGMPSSRRRRIMEQARRGNMPPSMMRRLMEFGGFGDFDDYDEVDDRHRYMMMHHMRRMHRMGPMEMEMLGMSRLRNRAKKVPTLTDPKWNAVYLKHRLYFYHQDIHDSVFCYDILDEAWYRTYLNYKSEKEDRDRFDTDVPDGIELIVMGQILYAVMRIVVFNTRPDRHFKSKEDKIEENKRQEVIVKHAVFKMTGELGNAKWEQVMDNGGHHEYIPIDKEKRLDANNDRRSLMEYYELGPFLRQPDSLRTILYAEDEEKLIVCCAIRKRYYRDETIVGFVISHIDMMYLDLKQSSHLLHSPDRMYFQRTVTPLFGDDLVLFLNDDLEAVLMLDLGQPGVWNRMMVMGHGEPEKTSKVLEALKEYPRCQSLIVSARDGKSIWALNGRDNDTSELKEVNVTTFYQTRKHELKTTEHTPPPFKCFALGMTAKLDRTLVKTLFPPTRYLHLD